MNKTNGNSLDQRRFVAGKCASTRDIISRTAYCYRFAIQLRNMTSPPKTSLMTALFMCPAIVVRSRVVFFCAFYPHAPNIPCRFSHLWWNVTKAIGDPPKGRVINFCFQRHRQGACGILGEQLHSGSSLLTRMRMPRSCQRFGAPKPNL